MKTLSTMLRTISLVTLAAHAGCDLPPNDQSDQEGEDAVAQAAVTSDGIPKAFQADKIEDVATTCMRTRETTTAAIKYTAVRGKVKDAVILSLRSQNGYLDLKHTRNGKNLGTQRVDQVLNTEQVLGRIVKGSETKTAHLMGEIASAALAMQLTRVHQCLDEGTNSRVIRNGETYTYIPLCDSLYRSLDAVAAAAAETAALACCSARARGVSCDACMAGGAAATKAFDAWTDPLQKELCKEEPERDEDTDGGVQLTPATHDGSNPG